MSTSLPNSLPEFGTTSLPFSENAEIIHRPVMLRIATREAEFCCGIAEVGKLSVEQSGFTYANLLYTLKWTCIGETVTKLMLSDKKQRSPSLYDFAMTYAPAARYITVGPLSYNPNSGNWIRMFEFTFTLSEQRKLDRGTRQNHT